MYPHVYETTLELDQTPFFASQFASLTFVGQVSHHDVAMEMSSVLVLPPFAAELNTKGGNEYLILFPAAVPPQRDRRKK